MAATVADTIRELTREHIEQRDGIVIGQCLTAVGWVQNTIPAQEKGMVELPMTDIAGAGFAVGAAIIGPRPIFVIRFQSFLWLNCSPIVNYAAKSKEMFGYPAPVFVRAIASEGDASGPVHTNCYHSLFMHMPGIAVVAPMTPNEYKTIWQHFLDHDDPMLVSEHRRSYKNTEDLPDLIEDNAEVVIYALSAGRFAAIEAVAALRAEGVRVSLINLLWIKPFDLTERILAPLRDGACGLIIDSAYEIAGAAQSIAYDLMIASGRPVRAVGMVDRSPGVARRLENGTPDAARIVAEALAMRADPWQHPRKDHPTP
ncbi:hypothetical protein JCM17960_34290 [Magnetospira thiophila]